LNDWIDASQRRKEQGSKNRKKRMKKMTVMKMKMRMME
jgi:hypothetical protein